MPTAFSPLDRAKCPHKKKKITKPKHCATDARNSKTCVICKNKHHLSICDKSSSTSTEPFLTTTTVIYPVVIVKINGVKCRAPLDMDSGSSYASEGLLDYSVKIQHINEKYSFNADLNKVEREVLLTLQNPKYSEILKKYPH